MGVAFREGTESESSQVSNAAIDDSCGSMYPGDPVGMGEMTD
jgi:hypothetical protein